jgi:hypothetical protein
VRYQLTIGKHCSVNVGFFDEQCIYSLKITIFAILLFAFSKSRAAHHRSKIYSQGFWMPDRISLHTSQRDKKSLSEAVRNSLMVILTLIFVFLYAAAFAGKLDPLKDNSMVLRFEPILFLLMGYYFGRFPARQDERVMKNEIERQAKQIDAAQFVKEKVQKDCKLLEERIENAKTVLRAIDMKKTTAGDQIKIDVHEAAFSILDS